MARNPHRCINCGRCMPVSPGRRRGKPSCDARAQREDECPAGALTLLGRAMTVEEVMAVVGRDIHYYRHTNGGMTLSGGEPLRQLEFSLALLEAARKAEINTVIETSCAAPQAKFRRVIGKADIYYCDVKASKQDYRRLTGADSRLVLANIAALNKAGCRIVLRVPCVDGVNMNDGFLEFVAQAAALEHVHEIDLLPFHDMGKGKAAMAGLEEPDWSSMRAPTTNQMRSFKERLVQALRRRRNPPRVLINGA